MRNPYDDEVPITPFFTKPQSEESKLRMERIHYGKMMLSPEKFTPVERRNIWRYIEMLGADLEKARGEEMKTKNEYHIDGEDAYLVITRKDGSTHTFVFDVADLPVMQARLWRIGISAQKLVAISGTGGGEAIRAHHLIARYGGMVKFRDRDRKNLRRNNLLRVGLRETEDEPVEESECRKMVDHIMALMYGE